MKCKSNRPNRIALAALLPGCVILSWWMLGYFGLLNTYLTPPPEDVFDAAIEAVESMREDLSFLKTNGMLKNDIDPAAACLPVAFME